MYSVLISISPVILSFFIGLLLKRTGIFKKDTGDTFLLLIYYVAGPALIFYSLATVTLAFDLIVFPVIAGLIIIINFILAITAAKFLKLSKPARGVFLISSMILNTGFILPFAIAGFGPEGVARLAIFELVSSTLTFTWMYAIACRHNPAGLSHKVILKKVFMSPPLWATVIAIAWNMSGIAVPEVLLTFTQSVGAIVGPLFMIALGLYFEPKIINLPPTLTAIAIRMVFGTIIGFALVTLFGLTGINKQLIILMAASPIGINTITFASLEKLDKELAASIVSVGLLIGLILTPVLMVILGIKPV